LKIDLHVHTTASFDGLNTPRAAIKWALKRGLDGIAVTDHSPLRWTFNKMAEDIYLFKMKSTIEKIRAAAPPGFIIIPGVEYSTDCGHVLALFCGDYAETVTRDRHGRYIFMELQSFIKERGGVLVAAHPFYGRDTLPENLLDAVDGLESINARKITRSPNNQIFAEETARTRGLFTTGGSDAHLPVEIGKAYTRFPDGTARDLSALKEALLSGRCTAEGKPSYGGFRIITALYKKTRKLIKK
jgi:predicted metal-dependent phosphoesterase TrpH